MTMVITLDGKIINVGPWDYKVSQEAVATKPFPGGPLPAPDDWDYGIEYIEVVGNPLPEGAIEEDIEIVADALGRIRRHDDYYKLRRAEYPDIRDQLDALFKAGAFPPDMAEQIQAVKDKYPKPD